MESAALVCPNQSWGTAITNSHKSIGLGSNVVETIHRLGASLSLLRSQGLLLAAGIYGLTRPSLRAIVGQLHQQHFRLNPAAAEWRYSHGRRILAFAGRHPRIAACMAFVVYAVAAAAVTLISPPPWAPPPPDGVGDFFRDFQTVNLGLLGAQATLLGLVYPLVIALIGLVVEARSTTGGRLQVYFQETEAFAVGGVSLALIITIGLQLLAYSVMPTNVLVCVSVLNVGWFTANLFALGFFVRRSLDFVRPAGRRGLMKSFLANTAWRGELYAGIFANRWANAVHYGYLLPPSDSIEGVAVTPFSQGPPLVEIKVGSPKQFHDARFGVLMAVARARSENTLRFHPWPASIYRDQVVLASGDGHVSPIERALIKRAFQFSPPPKGEAPPGTAEILKEAAADLLGLMQARRYEEFDALMSETIDLHGLLYALAKAPAEPSGPPFNYGALEPPSLWSNSIAWEWARAYVDLLRRAGEHLTEDDRYFEACAYLAPKLLHRASEVAPFAATEDLFNLPAILFRALVDGAARRHAESQTAPIARGELFTPSGVGAAFYRKTWQSFVGGWESVLNEITPDLEKDDWEGLRASVPALKRHLQDSALRTAQAAKAGEKHAIGWTADMLLKWYEGLSLRWSTHGGYALQRPIITLALLTRPWTEVVELPIMMFGDPPDERHVFEAAVENAWIDTLVVLACSLIGLFGAADDTGRIKDGPAEAAGAVVRNQSFDPGASGHPHSPPLDARTTLHAILRLVGAGERFEEGYGSEIGGLAEAIGRLEGPNYVSARMYSWSGEADVHGQAHPQVLLLAALVNLPGGPRRRRRDPVLVGDELRSLLLPSSDRVRRRLLDHLAQLRAALDAVDPKRGQAIIATLRDEDCTARDLKDRLAKVSAILRACETEITQAREAAIRSVQIDPERLLAVAKAAASTGFSKVAGAFPVWAFSRVTLVDDDMAHFGQRFSANRARYTTPLMEEPFSNEDDFWSTQMRDQAGALVFHDVLQARKPVRRSPRSATAYWAALKDAMAAVTAAGETPIIVRGDRSGPRWLNDWHYHPEARPPDMELRHVSGSPRGYDFELNDVAVYHSHGAGVATWILGIESFDHLEFRRFHDGKPVAVTFQADPTDPWKGTVVVDAGRRVTVGPGPIWRVAHPAPTPPV